MRIIKAGPDPSLEKQVTCQQCGTLFGYMPLDVRAQSYKDWDGVTDTNYIVKCPTCPKEFHVERPKGC